MPSYRYRAAHASGRVMQGVAFAADEADLSRFLGVSQLELIEAREKKSKVADHSRAFSRRRMPPRALAHFCAQATELLQAGLPFLDAIGELAAAMPFSALRDALNDVVRSLNHGSRIAAAFARHPRLFPPVFIAILASGETSGDIVRAFAQLAAYAEGRARTTERISRALRYPLFLMMVAFGVVTFMMALVVPQVLSFLESIDGQLPPATRMLVAVSGFFAGYWWAMALIVIGGIAAMLAARRLSQRVALGLDGAALKLPLVGPALEKLMLARFAQSLSILAQSGLTIPESLQGARDTLGNRALEAQFDVALARIVAGSPLSAALDGLFPAFALRVIKIGEQGGNLPKSLADIAQHYDRESADQAERMIGMLEPGLTLMIGAVLAWVVLAVMGPIYGSLTRMNMVN